MSPRAPDGAGAEGRGPGRGGARRGGAPPRDLEPLQGYPDQNKKKLQIFQVDGYLRLRADYMHDFFLGQGYSNVPGGLNPNGSNTLAGLPPFPEPLECARPTSSTIGNGISSTTGGNAGTTCSHKKHRRRQPAPPPRADAQHLGTWSASTRRSTSSTTRSSARRPDFARRHPGLQPAGDDDAEHRHGVIDGGPRGCAPRGSSRRPRIRPKSARTASSPASAPKRAWAEIDSEFGSVRFRPHALALGPRHRLQRRRLPRFATSARRSTA